MNEQEAYMAVIAAMSAIDSKPKNVMYTLEAGKARKVSFDCDAPLALDNGKYDTYGALWYRLHCSRIDSVSAMSPRGPWLMYAELYDGKVYAIGDEQGNYAGGILFDVSIGKAKFKQEVDKLANGDTYAKSLYEKIKDLPIADAVPVYDEQRMHTPTKLPNISEQNWQTLLQYHTAILQNDKVLYLKARSGHSIPLNIVAMHAMHWRDRKYGKVRMSFEEFCQHVVVQTPSGPKQFELPKWFKELQQELDINALNVLGE